MNSQDGQIFRNRARAESFGERASEYDATRPSYPPALVEWLSDGEAGRAVDVGCGTGQVARLLAAAGWDVVGVEIDPQMAEIARSHGLRVDVAAFEDWLPDGLFDLICAGQSWHWINPEHGVTRAADLLRAGGHLAVFWNAYVYDAVIRRVFDDVVARHAPDLLVDSVPFGTSAVSAEKHAAADARAFAESGRFGAVEVRQFAHRRDQSVDDWLREALTHSGIATLPPDVRAPLLDELRGTMLDRCGDVLTVRYDTSVTSARRT